MGMTNFQLMKDIELPLALPMVLRWDSFVVSLCD